MNTEPLEQITRRIQLIPDRYRVFTDGAEEAARIHKIPADLLPSPTEPDDLDRQLTQDEEMERQNRHQHHETPHFRKESD